MRCDVEKQVWSVNVNFVTINKARKCGKFGVAWTVVFHWDSSLRCSCDSSRVFRFWFDWLMELFRASSRALTSRSWDIVELCFHLAMWLPHCFRGKMTLLQLEYWWRHRHVTSSCDVMLSLKSFHKQEDRGTIKLEISHIGRSDCSGQAVAEAIGKRKQNIPAHLCISKYPQINQISFLHDLNNFHLIFLSNISTPNWCYLIESGRMKPFSFLQTTSSTHFYPIIACTCYWRISNALLVSLVKGSGWRSRAHDLPPSLLSTMNCLGKISLPFSIGPTSGQTCELTAEIFGVLDKMVDHTKDLAGWMCGAVQTRGAIQRKQIPTRTKEHC